jgi:hypothetical protein
MRGRHQLLLAGLCAALAPVVVGAQVRSQSSPDAWVNTRTRLPWPRTVGEFDSLRSNSLRSEAKAGLPSVRMGSTLGPTAGPAVGSAVYRAAAPAEPPARTSCPMPVYPSAPVTPMPGSAREGVPVAIDTAYVRGVLCDNPLDGRRR